MSKIKEILLGHLNEILDREKDLAKMRYAICEKCPLFKNTKKYGPICNHKLWIHPDTEEVSNFAKAGFVQGCGCRLLAKTRSKDSKCIINKW